jgi:hypothetical protein
MTFLEQYAGDLARTQRDALKFSDPIAHADRDVSMLVLDLNVAINRVRTVEDALRIYQQVFAWRKQVETLELAALVRANALLDGKD